MFAVYSLVSVIFQYRCRVCCSCAPRNVMYDNCLIGNFAAFKLQTGCEDDDMLYCSFDNDVSVVQV